MLGFPLSFLLRLVEIKRVGAGVVRIADPFSSMGGINVVERIRLRSQRCRIGRRHLGRRAHPDNGTFGWIAKTAVKNHWRVASWMDVDDLIQDGYEWYFKTRRNYPDVREDAHAMSLFKTSYTNYLHDLSKKRTGLNEVDGPADIDKDQWFALNLVESGLQEFAVLVAGAPDVVKGFLALFADEKIVKLLRKPYAPDLVRRVTTNQRICRLLRDIGMDVDPGEHDVLAEVRQFFGRDEYDDVVSCLASVLVWEATSSKA